MVWQLLANGVIAGGIYALVALGFSLIYRTVRFFHLAHGAVYTAGGYTAYTLNATLGLPQVVAVAGAALGAAVIGVLMNSLVYRPLRENRSSDLVLLLASFGLFIAVQNALQLIYGAGILVVSVGSVAQAITAGPIRITGTQLIIIATTIFLLVGVFLGLNYTGVGRILRGVADDPMVAEAVGIDSERVITWTFAIGSAIAGIAGTLISFETNLEPTMGFTAILKGIVASILGGVGHIGGAVLGGFLLGIVENLAVIEINTAWKDSITFVLLILFLLIRPQGLLGSVADVD
jgi:branched-chain amino acid transport system permease protein